MRRRSRKLVLAAFAVFAIGVGSAVAYYTSAGGGTGSASVASPAELSITAITPAGGLLSPGQAGEVDARISNPNPFPVRVNSLVLTGGGIDIDGARPGCDVSALDYTTQDNGTAGWDVPASVGAVDGTLDLQLAGALSMDRSAADACQGATFVVHLAAGP